MGWYGKYTPGPWEVRNAKDVFAGLGQDNREGLTADDNDGWQVADCVPGATSVQGELRELSMAEQKANAHLIAAAPDLLMACLALVEAEVDIGTAGKMADAALAKALNPTPGTESKGSE